MTCSTYILAVLCAAVSAAPPSSPRLYQQAPAQLQQINPLDYYLDNPEVANYYNQPQQKQGGSNSDPNSAPARLETLEPDSEVELIPGAQTPQQPPQQPPVSPNIPGLLPGQRVYIVHMPVPGYRPGTIGGYQPVYIVAAAPQGNPGYPGVNGYQNAFLLDPSGQAVISPLVGYPRAGVAGITPQAANPGLLLGPAPLTLNRHLDLVYQDPNVYQPTAGTHGSIKLSQLVALQGQPAHPANNERQAADEATSNSEAKRGSQASESTETRENAEPRRSARPTQAQPRNKA